MVLLDGVKLRPVSRMEKRFRTQTNLNLWTIYLTGVSLEFEDFAESGNGIRRGF